MAKFSVSMSQPHAPEVAFVPELRLWPRLHDAAGSAWARLMNGGRRTLVRCVSLVNDCDEMVPVELGRVPRRVWRRHSAYLVYDMEVRAAAARRIAGNRSDAQPNA
ncbi:MAG: hypothetical protein P8Y64_02360 [Gammaproteobacteria bacterium]|jgi:hypothetical protein